MRKETFGRLAGAAVVLGFAVGLASFPSDWPIPWRVAPAHAGDQVVPDEPPAPCTVKYTETTVGAGQCPGGQGSACETQTYTKTSTCVGTCNQEKPYCVSFEKTLQLVYRRSVYQGDCDPPSDCVLVDEEKRWEMITSVCICSATAPD